MEREVPARVSLPTFCTDEALHAPASVTLGEDAAHHMRVRRLDVGARVRLLDGQGSIGEGALTQLAKRHATVAVEQVTSVEAAAPVHLMLPVADKDRMLWLAEKVTELGVASWRPVTFRRSKHVNPRGEGPVFQQKTRARMVSALEQSGGAWLPTIYPEATVEHAIAAKPEAIGVILDAGAPSALEVIGAALEAAPAAAITVVVGPEGGFEESEKQAFLDAGFLAASIGKQVLRFETAGVAGVVAARLRLEA